MTLKNLIGLDLADFEKVCLHFKEPSFRAKQLFGWVYNKGIRSIDEMSNLPKPFKEKLCEIAAIKRLNFSSIMQSTDGTQKWLLEFEDKNLAECVHIPEKTRGTLCVSSQVGCTLTCKFCHTGTQLLVRNLDASEILGQIIAARDVFDDWAPPTLEKRHVSNIVMMGMGEPLYNYENVKKALQIALHQDGLAFSRHKITLSTSGVVPEILNVARDLRVNLAISLHAVRNDLRNEIMPLNKKYPLEELIRVVRQYPEISKTDKVTFEYVMLKDVNDSVADAKELCRLIKGIPSKINIIPFNPWPSAPFERSTDQQIKKFADVLERAGYQSPIRKPRGEDIFAACGQLKSLSERKKKNKVV
ncbi:MAG: Dual-specificity RNA methyltransferase RlmN [Holosporales bacterium]